MYQDIINESKIELDKIIEHFKTEIGALKTGRANPAMVEDVEVESYGTRVPLKQLAAIHTPEARTIVIQPWDRGVLKEIEKAIITFRSGLNPIVDGDLIRINIPSLTEERRKELVKILNKNLEESRISIRQQRDEVWKKIQELERRGRIREDDKFRGKDELQKVIDQCNMKLEEVARAKEQEVMTV